MKNTTKKRDETESNSFQLIKEMNRLVKNGQINGYTVLPVNNPKESGGITAIAQTN